MKGCGIVERGSSGFQFNDNDNWNSNSNVSSHLCCQENTIPGLATWQNITNKI